MADWPLTPLKIIKMLLKKIHSVAFHYRYELNTCSACINLLRVDCALTASEAGLCASAWLGPFPDEAPWGTLQEHDRPSGDKLSGPQTAPQGLPARHLPVAATQAAPHPPLMSPRRRQHASFWAKPPPPLLSPFPVGLFPSLLCPSLYCGCGNWLSTSSLPWRRRSGRVESTPPLLLRTHLLG